MEKIAYLVIGAAMAIVVMTLLPMSHMNKSPGMTDTDMPMDMSQMPNMDAMHQHPPREVSPELPMPSVNHLMFPDMMDGFNIQILTSNFSFTPAAINRAPVDNEGHAHIYVNGVKIARVYSDWYHLPGTILKMGDNEVRVTLNANDHSEWTVDGVPVSSVVRVQISAASQ